MERLSFIQAQPWFDPDTGPLHAQEQAFAALEIFEGMSTMSLTCETALPTQQLGFHASVLASSQETRLRLAICAGEVPSKKRKERGGESTLEAALETAVVEPAGGEGEVRDGLSGAALLARFETAGKALQGRILHTQIVQMTDNVSSDVWHQPNHLDPPFVRLGFAAVELTIMPLPELSPSTGADQLRRVIGRMLSLPSASPPPPCALVEGVTGAAGASLGSILRPTLPRAVEAAARSAVSAVDKDSCDYLADGLRARTAHWNAFVRCARQLADELEFSRGSGGAALTHPRARCSLVSGRPEHGMPATASAHSAASSTYAFAGSDCRPVSLHPPVARLLAEMPEHLMKAMPSSLEAARGDQLHLHTREVDATVSYIAHATAILCGPSGQGNQGAAGLAAPGDDVEPPLEQWIRLRRELETTSALSLSAQLLPSRHVR